jgi:hypothetical protein
MRNYVMTENDLFNLNKAYNVRKLDLEVEKIGMVFCLALVWHPGEMTGEGESMTAVRYKTAEERDRAMVTLLTSLDVPEAPKTIGGERIDLFVDDMGEIRVDVSPWGRPTPRKVEVSGKAKPKAKAPKQTKTRKGKLPKVTEANEPREAEASKLYDGKLEELAHTLEQVADGCKAAPTKRGNPAFNDLSLEAAELINGINDSGETEDLLYVAQDLWAAIENSKPNRRSKIYKVCKALVAALPARPVEAAAE